ncbi:MAG: winged helix-turn-helix transcriptional regulator [Ktedonobacterales bacterium]
MEASDGKRERDREDREGGKFDVGELVNDLALDDDMGPDWWWVPPIDRAYMYHLRDMTFRQIAERLHISENTARQYVRKMERETAPKLKDMRERLVGHAIDRMRGLTMETAAHYDRTGNAKLLPVRLRCEMELARLQGVYAIAQEAATHEGSESEGGHVPIRFFDASAALDAITGGSARDSEGDSGSPNSGAGDGAALG